MFGDSLLKYHPRLQRLLCLVLPGRSMGRRSLPVLALETRTETPILPKSSFS